MITEEQAKQKWCPFSRVLLPVNQSGNRISTFHLNMVRKSGDERDIQHYEQQQRDCNCIASGCMAWRWGSYVKPLDDGTLANTGYCGLAGNPRP